MPCSRCGADAPGPTSPSFCRACVVLLDEGALVAWLETLDGATLVALVLSLLGDS